MPTPNQPTPVGAAKPKPKTALTDSEARALVKDAAAGAQGGFASRARVLYGLLHDKRRPVVRAAAVALADYGEEEGAAAQLAARYDELDCDGKKLDPLCLIRKVIVDSLGALGDRSYAHIAHRALHTIQVEPVGFGPEDTALDLRMAAAQALLHLESDPAYILEELGLLLFDYPPNTATSPNEEPFAKATSRRIAAKCLSRWGNPLGASVLAIKLATAWASADRVGEVPEVLAECMEAYCALRPEGARAAVAPYLRSPDPFLASSAAIALAEGLAGEALELLASALEEAPKEARVPIIYAITGIRNKATGPTLASLFAHRDAGVRKAAAEGAGLYRTAEIDEALHELAADDPDPGVRRAASASLRS